MFKIFSYLASILIGQLIGQQIRSAPYKAIVDYALAQMQSMARSAAFEFSGIVLILTGFLITIFNLLATYDLKGYLTMSAVAGGGITIFAMGSVVVLIPTFKKNKIEIEISPSEKRDAPSHSLFAEAFADLISEFVQNRKEKKQTEKQNHQQFHANNGAAAQ